MNQARTYNHFHTPRNYRKGNRRVTIYNCWSYPAEVNRDVSELDNRFTTWTEVRRVQWPFWEKPEYSPKNFMQGIAGTLELFFKVWSPFQELAGEITGNSVPFFQRVDQGGYQLPIDERVLGDTDTLLVYGLDTMITEQLPSQAEIEAIREWLSHEGNRLIIGPHHDVGASSSNEVREMENRHHGDPLVPLQQRYASYCRELLKALNIPVENRWGLKPASAQENANEVAPLHVNRDLDKRGWLMGVTALNFHKHLPHYEVTDKKAKSVHVLAKQPIDMSNPHPFVEAGNTEFNRVVWVEPEGKRAADVLFADSTEFSTLFGQSESLKQFWRNVVK